jgi:hypothetical protein
VRLQILFERDCLFIGQLAGVRGQWFHRGKSRVWSLKSKV